MRDAVRAEAVAPLVLKGKSEPVPAFRVLEVLDDVPAFTRPVAASSTTPKRLRGRR